MKDFIFWILFLSWVTANILACRDQYPEQFNQYDAAQLEGLWYNDPQPAMPKKWFWHFSDGQLHQQTFDFGQLIVEHWWGYDTRADTLFLREMLEPEQRKTFTVFFESDSMATLSDITGTIHVEYKLKRF